MHIIMFHGGTHSEKDTADYTTKKHFRRKTNMGFNFKVSFPVTNKRIPRPPPLPMQRFIRLRWYRWALTSLITAGSSPQLALSPWSMAGHSPLLRVNDPRDPTRVVRRGGSPLSPSGQLLSSSPGASEMHCSRKQTKFICREIVLRVGLKVW